MTHAHVLLACGALLAATATVEAAELTRTRTVHQDSSAAGCPESIPPARPEATLLDTTHALEHAAAGCESQSQYARAIALLRESIRLREADGGEHLSLVTPLTRLGRIQRELGALAEAERQFERALAIADREKCPAVVSINLRMELGDLYRLTGKDAVPLYQHALASAESTYGAGDVRVASVVNNWALFEKSQGRYLEASRLYERALAIRQKVSGPQHPDTATVMSNMGVLARLRGDRAEALRLLYAATRIWEAAFGPNDTAVATGLSNIASILSEAKKYDRAEGLYRRAITIAEQRYGVSSLRVAQELNNLGAVLFKSGKADDAQAVFRRAMEIHTQVAPSSLDTARVLRNLGETAVRREALDEAEALFRRALAIWDRQRVDLTSDEALGLIESLSTVLRSQEQYAEAEKLAARAMRIRVKQALLAEHRPAPAPHP